MPKYTVITPMYKSFDLMEKYFESLENQTFKDFEVIIVDDCSPNDAYERVLDYSKTASLNIRVYRTEKNSGPGIARNIGMENAFGEWITFIDNDDWVESNLFEEIENVLKLHSVDCVIYDYYIQKNDNNQVGHSMYIGDEGIMSISDCVSFTRNHSIGKFYKLEKCREFSVKFPALRRCEDVAFVARAIVACGSAYYLKKPLYHYVQRTSSLSNNTVFDESDMISAFSIVEDALYVTYSQEICEKSVTDLLYGVTLMMCKAKKSKKEIKEHIRAYTEKYPNWHKCQIIKSLGNAKRVFLFAARKKWILMLRSLTWAHSKMI